MHKFWKVMVAAAALTGFTAAVSRAPTSLTPVESPASPVKQALPIAPPSNSTATLTKTDVEAWLDGFMPFALARNDIAGAVVVVVKNDQVLAQKGYGYADVAQRKKVDPATTLFRPGSVSKLFTWTAVMQLVERGQLDLDRDVNGYLDFKIPPLDGKPITLRNILTHTTGFEESVRYLIARDAKGLMPLGAYAKNALPNRVFTPGTMPAYSNYATALAGHIVARKSGMSFDDYVDRNIFQPLEMNDSSFRQPLPAALQSKMSLGYPAASGDAKPFEIVIPAPAGSLSASGADMAKFMLAHLADGKGLLQPETAKLMHTTQFKTIPPLNGMALGFYEQGMNGRRTIGHGGDTELFHSDLWLVPSEQIGVFVSINSGGTPGASFAVRQALFDQFGDRYLPGIRDTALVDATTARKHAQEMVGSYTASRGIFTNFLRILDFVGQAKIGLDGKGNLVTEAVPGLANETRKWVEIAPYVWRDANSGERLAAKLENGRVVRWSFDIVSPFIVYNRTPWYLDSSWLMPAALASLGILLLTALSWPVGAFTRRRYKATLPFEGRRLQVHRSVLGLAWASLLALGTWIAFITVAFTSLDGLSGTYDWLLWTAQVLTPIALVGLLAFAAWDVRLSWTKCRGWFSKLWSVLLLLASVILLWVALGFNLIGFGTHY